MRSASYEASMTTLSLVRGQATTYTLLSMGPRVSLVTCIKHSLHACVSTQPSASGSHFEPPRRKRSGILPLVVPPAATTKRAAPARCVLAAQWPSWDHCDAPCAMGAHVALSPAGDCVPHLPWERAACGIA